MKGYKWAQTHLDIFPPDTERDRELGEGGSMNSLNLMLTTFSGRINED